MKWVVVCFVIIGLFVGYKVLSKNDGDSLINTYQKSTDIKK